MVRMSKPRRIRQTKFAPKPFGIGAVTDVDGRSFTIQDFGPRDGTRWAADQNGKWELLRLPVRTQPARILIDAATKIHAAERASQVMAMAEAIRHGVAVEAWDLITRTVHASSSCRWAAGRHPVTDVNMARAAVDFLNVKLEDSKPSRQWHLLTVCECVADSAGVWSYAA